jgi:hypothetical protein
MSCQDMGDTLEIIFSADQRNDGRFTLQGGGSDRLMTARDQLMLRQTH